ncbi:MAG: phosphoglycerate dehydrogenase [Bifidobacteriaceae bacterium]|jgi:D-3-phosphoglycerate dehydrogenase|nr:phosphoglycerate dehydrogenase [Bifidobacteriaceae bacterium]
MKTTVLIPEDIAEKGKRFLRRAGHEVVVGDGADPATILRQGRHADAVILRLSPFGADLIEQLPNLRVIARHGVGYDNVDVAAATRHGVWVTNTPWANASSVAETALTLLLTLAKRVVENADQMRDGNFYWKNTHMGVDVAGKKVGIVGYGKIGRELAAKLSGLGVEILVHDPHVDEVAHGSPVGIDQLLRESDFVSLHLPAGPETDGSFGAAAFAAMKSTACLINLARGSIVDQPALAAAIREGQIAGAALDVFQTEPPSPDDPLFGLENVLLTPHIASNTVETMERMALHAAQEVDRVLAGDAPSWPVNTPEPSVRPGQAGRVEEADR